MVTERCWPPIHIDYRLSINRTRFSKGSLSIFCCDCTREIHKYSIYLCIGRVRRFQRYFNIFFFFFLLLKASVVCFHSIKSLQWNNGLNIYIYSYKYIKYTEIEIQVLLFKKQKWTFQQFQRQIDQSWIHLALKFEHCLFNREIYPLPLNTCRHRKTRIIS